MARVSAPKDTPDTAANLPIVGGPIGEVPVAPVAPPQPVPMPKHTECKVTVEGPGWTATLVFANEQERRTAIAGIANKTGRGQECEVHDLNGRHWFTANMHLFVGA